MKKSSNKSNIQIIKDYLEGERPFLQVGYTPDEKKREIGEQWEDVKGITWEQRKGYRVRVNKQADLIRATLDSKCEDCAMEIKWGTHRDMKSFNETGKCDECLVKFQTKLMFYGVMDEYDKWKMLNQKMSLLKDFKDKVKDSIEYFTNDDGSIKMLCNSEGFLETFRGFDTKTFLEDAKKDLEMAEKEMTATRKKITAAKRLFDRKYKSAEKRMMKQYAKK